MLLFLCCFPTLIMVKTIPPNNGFVSALGNHYPEWMPFLTSKPCLEFEPMGLRIPQPTKNGIPIENKTRTLTYCHSQSHTLSHVKFCPPGKVWYYCLTSVTKTLPIQDGPEEWNRLDRHTLACHVESCRVAVSKGHLPMPYGDFLTILKEERESSNIPPTEDSRDAGLQVLKLIFFFKSMHIIK